MLRLSFAVLGLVGALVAPAPVSAGGDDNEQRFYEATPENLIIIYARLTEETKSQLPIRLDENTTLVDITLGGGEWHHRLEVDEWPSDNSERRRVESELEEQARGLTCANPGNRELMAAGYGLRRTYVLKTGVEVFDLLFRPEDCGLGDL